MNGKIFILSVISIVLFGIFVSAEGSFSVNIIHPENNSILKGDFFIIDAVTDVNANCSYILDGREVNEMEYTGELEHSSSIIGIEETTHNLGVFCEDSEGNLSYSSVDFTINLSDTRNYMILEDISDYKYFYSLPLDLGPGILNN